MRKIIRISKTHRITSLADFVSSRYGKSALLGGLVTLIAVVAWCPTSRCSSRPCPQLHDPHGDADAVMAETRMVAAIGADPAFWIALVLAAFTILFGTRHLDASERHEGMVAAVAFESLVKLVAFLAIGAFVTYGLYDGVADIFERARGDAALAHSSFRCPGRPAATRAGPG